MQKDNRIPADLWVITGPNYTNNNSEINIRVWQSTKRPLWSWKVNMQSDVERRLRRFIGEYFLSQEEPWSGSGDASLRDSGVILYDTELLELIEFLEKAFGIALLDDEIHPKNLDTIHALTACVERKVAQALANVASGKTWRGSRRARTEPAAGTASAVSSASSGSRTKTRAPIPS